MKKLNRLFLAIGIAIAIASCSIQQPIAITKNPVGSKKGIAEKKVFMGIMLKPTDIGIQKAAANGGIKKISTVEFEAKYGLFIQKYKTVVTGE
jgi:hypothetical protein